MRPVRRTVEEVDNLIIYPLRVDLHTPEKFAPLGARCRADRLEIKVRNLRLGVCARLVRGNERDTDADEDSSTA